MQLQHPLAFLLVIAAGVFSLVVRPWLHSGPFRWTLSKLTAAAVVLLYCLYFYSPLPVLILAWPLSLIYFPSYWATFRGWFQGPSVSQDSPPVLIAVFGWIFLTVYPIAVIWISGIKIGGP